MLVIAKARMSGTHSFGELYLSQPGCQTKCFNPLTECRLRVFRQAFLGTRQGHCVRYRPCREQFRRGTPYNAVPPRTVSMLSSLNRRHQAIPYGFRPCIRIVRIHQLRSWNRRMQRKAELDT
jgi:hypothetical protein